jgi:hypothetical protein
MMRLGARCWLSALLLAGCELSPESSGKPLDMADEPPDARAQADAESTPENRAEDAEATARDASQEATPDGSAGGDGLDGGHDASSANDGEISRPEGDASASGETVFVSVGSEDNTPWLYTSCDGRAWTRRTLSLPSGHPTGAGGGLRGIGYGAGTFVITGGGAANGGNVRLLGSSVDGVTWQWEEGPLACTNCQWMGGAAFLDDGKDGVWIAGGGTGTRLYSKDHGRSWQTSSGEGLAPYRRFRSDGTRAVGAGQGVLTVVELAAAGASEPAIWHDSAEPVAHESVYIAAGNGAFVVIWYDDGCRVLRDGTTFHECDLPSGHDPILTSVVFGDGKFSILGHGAPLQSSDGEHWTLADSGTGSDFRDVAYADGTYATSELYSTDASDWKAASPSALNGTAIAVGKLRDGRSCPR